MPFINLRQIEHLNEHFQDILNEKLNFGGSHICVECPCYIKFPNSLNLIIVALERVSSMDTVIVMYTSTLVRLVVAMVG